MNGNNSDDDADQCPIQYEGGAARLDQVVERGGRRRRHVYTHTHTHRYGISNYMKLAYVIAIEQSLGDNIVSM